MDCDKSEREVQEVDPGHVTHLAVDWGRNIKKNEVYDYGREDCYPREGVELPMQKAKMSSPTTQKPDYRPKSSTGSGGLG